MQDTPKKHLRLLATCHGMNHIYQLLPPVILPVLTLEFGIFSGGFLLWSFVLSYSLLPALSGYLSLYVGRRNLITAGFIMIALSLATIGLTSNIFVLAILFFIAGVGGSIYHPLGSPILAEAYPLSRGRTLGLHQTGGAIGSFIGPFITGLMVSGLGWRPTLVLFAIPGLILAAALWFSISPKQTEPNQQEKNGIRLLDLRMYAPAFLFMVAAFIYVLGQRGTDVFANQYFTFRGIDIALASLLFSMLKLAGLFSAPICGRLSDKYGRKIVLIVLVVVESLSLFTITISPVLLLAIPCIIFGFASFGLLGVGEALLADITPKKERPAFFGINQTLSFSPQTFLLPLLFGLTGYFGYNSGFILLSILMPISIPILLLVRAKNGQQSREKKF